MVRSHNGTTVPRGWQIGEHLYKHFNIPTQSFVLLDIFYTPQFYMKVITYLCHILYLMLSHQTNSGLVGLKKLHIKRFQCQHCWNECINMYFNSFIMIFNLLWPNEQTSVKYKSKCTRFPRKKYMYENVVLKMSTILFRFQCVKYLFQYRIFLLWPQVW